MSPLILIFIVMIGVMFLMTRSARNKQRQALEMRNKMEPGSGVRTIGGIYAVVKEVNEETVLLELTDGVHVHFAKNAIGTVLSEDEFNRIVHGIEPEEPEDAEGAEGTREDTADAARDAAGGAHDDGTGTAAGAKDEHSEHDEHVDLKKTGEAAEHNGSGAGTGAGADSK
ncbi:preprotein translocase subunit YajC [Streptomyces sp. HPF1205]|uniref:preprotein translocase subunit YajC n=1 Tax=Streptomyces sp. HPF1205 TaxID=2873262 RepID=UPI001CEDBEEA|nr:preprotein translocase subunit YajC [Streptomyces sp. HPF1205]